MPTFRIRPPAHRRGRLVLPPPLFQLRAPSRPAANTNSVHQASVLAAAGAVLGAAVGSCAALALALVSLRSSSAG